MKTQTISIAAITLAFSMLFAGIAMAQTKSAKPVQVFIQLKNNSLLPQKFKLVSYEPGTPGNGTQTFFLLPWFSKSLNFREGTRLFLVNQKQIDTVMSGNSLEGKPWYVVREKDHQQSINLCSK